MIDREQIRKIESRLIRTDKIHAHSSSVHLLLGPTLQMVERLTENNLTIWQTEYASALEYHAPT